MADDPTTAPAISPEGGGEGSSSPPPPPSIDERLNWNSEEHGDLADDLRSVPLEELGQWRDQLTEKARQEARQQFEQEQRQAAERRRQEEAAAADLQQDINYADDIDRRLGSINEQERTEAQAELAENRERYSRGIYNRTQKRQEEQRRQVIAEHYDPLMRSLAEAGHKELADTMAQRLPEYGMNPLMAALEYGRALGQAEGSAQAADVREREQRINEGREGMPGDSSSSTRPTPSRYDDENWVRQQVAADPQWTRKPSGQTDPRTGREMNNGQAALRARIGRRARADRATA